MAKIFGSPGADLRTGTGGDDRVSGGPAGSAEQSDAANDTLNAGSGGEDTIFGWGGDDSIVGSDGGEFNYDNLYGGDGNDTIQASQAEAYGEGGDDLIISTRDRLSAIGGAGRDTLIGNAEFDNLSDDTVANTDADQLFGGGGANFLISYGGADTLEGGDGDDFVHLYRNALTVGFRFTPASADVVYVASDGTQVVGIERFARIEGGSGNDTISGIGSGAATFLGYDEVLFGNDGDDLLTGERKDAVFGGAGADTIAITLGEAYGGADADWIVGSGQLLGEDGNDTLIATGPNGNVETRLLGGAGADSVLGSESLDYLSDDGSSTGSNIDSDTLTGGRGRDTLASFGGADRINGGGGEDTAEINRSFLSETLRFRAPDAVTPKTFADGTRVANVENFFVTGGSGADRLFGNAGTDTLAGGIGDDMLQGGFRIDRLDGGDGADTLLGGDGADLLSGGDGGDRFRWDTIDGVGDYVIDFDSSDILQSTVAATGGLLPVGRIAASHFAVSTPTAATPQFVFRSDDRSLLWDADGTGSDAAVAVAGFGGTVSPMATDIVIIA